MLEPVLNLGSLTYVLNFLVNTASSYLFLNTHYIGQCLIGAQLYSFKNKSFKI